MIRKIIAIALQLLMLFCLIYSTIVPASIIPYYLFFPAFIIFLECFGKINLKKLSTVVVFVFYMLELSYALFLYWKKAEYISAFYPLIVGLLCIIPEMVKWLLKKTRKTGDGSPS